MSDYSGDELKKQERTLSRKRHSASLFGPIVLISIGVYFLLYNLGMVGSLNWYAALQLWPLFLIFVGLNIIAGQFPSPWGSLLSVIVALAAVGLFGYVLLFGTSETVSQQLGLRATDQVTMQRDEIALTAENVETAVIDINFGSPSAQLTALEAGSSDLIKGFVTYGDDLSFESSVENGAASVTLDTRDNSGWFWLFPGTWSAAENDDQWLLGLNRSVPIDMRLDVGSGAVNLELQELLLQELVLDGGSGSLRASLPGGEYDVSYDAGSGSTFMLLPENGRHLIEVDGSSGSIVFVLPHNMAARVDVDGGSGSFTLPKARFSQVSGDEKDGVWQTAGYENAANRVNLILDVSSGSVRIEEPR